MKSNEEIINPLIKHYKLSERANLRFLDAAKEAQIEVSKEQNELIETLEQYINLLGEEINALSSIASNKGWVSKRYEKGLELRNKIKSLKSEIND
jgi:hypothetical protein